MIRRILFTVLILASPVAAQTRRTQFRTLVPEIDPSGSREALILLIAALLLIAPVGARAIADRTSRSSKPTT